MELLWAVRSRFSMNPPASLTRCDQYPARPSSSFSVYVPLRFIARFA
nr:MAG TPA: hypothetical protein [Caudoviricetes sp.]